MNQERLHTQCTFKMGHITLKEFTYKIIQNIFNKNCLNIVIYGYSPEIENTCILQKKSLDSNLTQS